MRKHVSWRRRALLWTAGVSLYTLGGCGLSDAQLTGILQSAVSTGLNTLVSTGISALSSQTSATDTTGTNP